MSKVVYQRLVEKSPDELREMIANPSSYRANALEIAREILEEYEKLPDYSSYSNADLNDIMRNIDEYEYPIRFQAVLKEVQSRHNGSTQMYDPIHERLRISYTKVEMDFSRVEIDQNEFIRLYDHGYEHLEVSDDTTTLTVFINREDDLKLAYKSKNDPNSEYECDLEDLNKGYVFEILTNFISGKEPWKEMIEWDRHSTVPDPKAEFRAKLITVGMVVISLIVLANKYLELGLFSFIPDIETIISNQNHFFIFIGLFTAVFVLTSYKDYKNFKKISGKARVSLILIPLFLILMIIIAIGNY